MAASKDFSSSQWIDNIDLFYAYLEAGYANKSSLLKFIHPDKVDKVFSGLKQFFYWAKRFQYYENEAIVTLAILSPEGLIKPDIYELQKKIVSSLGPGNISSINYSENANFVSFVLISPEAAHKVRQEVAWLNGALVCYVGSRSHNTYKIRILWTPIDYQLEGIEKSLKPWCEETSLVFEEDIFSNGEIIVNNKINGSIKLKDNVSLLQLPHIIKLDGEINKFVLLVISEREPMCLKCKNIGHMRRTCPFFRCPKCAIMHEINSDCIPKSFASIVRLPRHADNELYKSKSFFNENSGADQVIRGSDSGASSFAQNSLCSDATSIVESDDFQLVTKRFSRNRNSVRKDLNVNIISNKQGFNLLHDEMDSVTDNILITEGSELLFSGPSSNSLCSYKGLSSVGEPSSLNLKLEDNFQKIDVLFCSEDHDKSSLNSRNRKMDFDLRASDKTLKKRKHDVNPVLSSLPSESMKDDIACFKKDVNEFISTSDFGDKVLVNPSLDYSGSCGSNPPQGMLKGAVYQALEIGLSINSSSPAINLVSIVKDPQSPPVLSNELITINSSDLNSSTPKKGDYHHKKPEFNDQREGDEGDNSEGKLVETLSLRDFVTNNGRGNNYERSTGESGSSLLKFPTELQCLLCNNRTRVREEPTDNVACLFCKRIYRFNRKHGFFRLLKL